MDWPRKPQAFHYKDVQNSRRTVASYFIHTVMLNRRWHVRLIAVCWIPLIPFMIVPYLKADYCSTGSLSRASRLNRIYRGQSDEVCSPIGGPPVLTHK